jgi:hypothetical protein
LSLLSDRSGTNSIALKLHARRTLHAFQSFAHLIRSINIRRFKLSSLSEIGLGF